ncbi:MAG: clostripain-related cysteine peptidase [Polyangiales bacterium]
MRNRVRTFTGLAVVIGSMGLAGSTLAQGFPPIPPEIAKQLPPGMLPPGALPGTTPTPSTPPPSSSPPGTPATPVSVGGVPVSGPQAGVADWTVLVYQDADNDLEGPILDDLDELERVGSVKGVNVVVQIDRWRPKPGSPAASRDDKTNGDWDQAKRFYVTRDDGSTTINSKELSDLGEIDMSHPKELANFLAWGIKTFPAKHYALVMEDHGSGWRGGFVDEKAPPEATPMMMTLAEMKDGLATGLKAAGIEKLDLFATDACLMGMVEVADAIAPHTKYWVASEELQPGAGFEYTMALAPLSKDTKIDGATLGKAFVGAMRQAYGPTAKSGDPTVTAALFDMSKIPAVRAALDNFATRVASSLEDDKIGLGMASEVVDTFGPRTDPVNGPKEGYADLVQVAAVVRDTTKKPEIKASAAALIAAVDAARLDKHMGAERANARGLSVFMPPPEGVAKFLPAYQKTPFGKTSPWASLLHAYGNAFAASTAPKVSNVVIGKNPGNPFAGERPVTAQIDGEVRGAVMVISQDFLGNKVPVEIVGITDPALYKKLPEGPGVTAWNKTTNKVSAKWTPMYATLGGKGGMEFPLVVNHEKVDATAFDADVNLRVIGGPAEVVMLRFAMPKGAGYAGSKLLTGYFIDQVEGQTFYTPFTPAKLPPTKVAFEPVYTIVDSSGKATELKLPLQVKWDKIDDLKIQVRPMLPGNYQIMIIAEDFNGHVGVAKATTTLP